MESAPSDKQENLKERQRRIRSLIEEDKIHLPSDAIQKGERLLQRRQILSTVILGLSFWIASYIVGLDFTGLAQLFLSLPFIMLLTIVGATCLLTKKGAVAYAYAYRSRFIAIFPDDADEFDRFHGERGWKDLYGPWLPKAPSRGLKILKWLWSPGIRKF